MHKPNITMACVVHCKNKFLFVEELEYGKMTLNQPAGHLEINESIIAGAQRELFEETGIKATISHLIKIYQWHAPQSKTDYLRFVFAVELDDWQDIKPLDSDISGGHWLSLEEFHDYTNQPGQCARNPLVLKAVMDYMKGEFYPIEILSVFTDKS